VTAAEVTARAVEEVHRLSIDGIAPSMRDYEQFRAPGAPSCGWLYNLGVSWSEVIRQSGLRKAVNGRTRQTRGQKLTAEQETDAYVANAQRRRLRQPYWHDDRPLTVVASSARQEVHEVPQPDGTVLRITRTIASLR